MRPSALLAALLALTPAPAQAWEPRAATIAARRAAVAEELQHARRSARARRRPDAAEAAAMKVRLRYARQRSRPEWIERRLWSLEVDGRTWVLGVGVVRNVVDAREALRAAELYAEHQLVEYEAVPTVDRERGVEGERTTVRSGGRLVDVGWLDWYLAPDGTAYALAVHRPAAARAWEALERGMDVDP